MRPPDIVAASAPAVSLDAVSRVFAGGLEALAGVSLSVPVGSVVAVVGPSGCGKTTLLELVCGLQAPDAGRLVAAPAALMPQRDLLLPWLSAIDNAALALRVRGIGREQARAQALPWLQRFGLREFARAPISSLSGGMRQRVSFLRTLLAGKPVLCLDEPFAALDALTRADMQGWLGHLLSRSDDPAGAPWGWAPASAAAPSVLLVTHDVEEAVLLADLVVVLSPRPGRVIAAIDVDLPRPRERTDPAVVELRASALRALEAAR